MSGENTQELKRSLGLFSATSMLIGCVVGASVFIVPGGLAASNGPAVWVSYLIGAVLVGLSCFMFAQIGSVLPVPGANYVLCSRTISGLWGFLYIWVFFISTVWLFPIMAKTAAQYIGVFAPGLNVLSVALGIIALTGILNLFGSNLSATVQNLMVILLIGVVLIFSGGGIANANWSHFSPMFPKGVMPVIVAAVSTYYAFAGFNNIIELSGEIKNPKKNIPLTIWISFGVIIIMYLGMVFALVGLIKPDQMPENAPAVAAAALIFPKWFSGFISAAAVVASWTTLNTVLVAMSRDIYALAKSGLFPKFLAKVNRFGVPQNSVILLTIIAFLFTLFSASLMRFINISGTYLLATSLVVAVASLKIKEKLPKEYEAATYKLKGFWYKFWPLAVIVSSIFFMILAFKDDLVMSLASLVMVPIGLLWYTSRKKRLEKEGVSLEDLIKQQMYEDDDHSGSHQQATTALSK